MKEIRCLRAGDLRQLCIEKNWYTRGLNEDYEKMLRYADTCVDESGTTTTEDIVKIARNILFNSKTDHSLTSICFEIARICRSFFEEEIEE